MTRVAIAMPEGLGISVVALAELYDGVYGSNDQATGLRKLQGLLNGLPLVPLDREPASICGRERVGLRRQVRIIADLDILIAASALRHHATLLTNNRRD